MGIEHERCKTQRKDGNPEVNKEGCPNRQGRIEQHNQRPHAQVYAWTCKAGKEDAEGYPTRGESTSCGDVTSSSEVQVAQNRVGVDLSREDFEHRGEGTELLRKSKNGFDCSTLHKF